MSKFKYDKNVLCDMCNENPAQVRFKGLLQCRECLCGDDKEALAEMAHRCLYSNGNVCEGRLPTSSPKGKDNFSKKLDEVCKKNKIPNLPWVDSLFYRN